MNAMAEDLRSDGALQAQWARVRARLREEYGAPAYRSWFRPMSLVELRDGCVRIAVPARFMRDWVAQHYGDRMRALWNAENSDVVAVEFVIAAGAEPAEAASREAADGPDLKDISASLDPRCTFENF